MGLTIELTQKVVLVTGVTSGIGAGIASMFARAGATVAGCARQPESSEGARSFMREMERHGSQHLYLSGDLSDPGVPEVLVQEVADRMGRLDILVSNAGANVFRGAEACSEAAWTENLQLNVASHWRLAKACRPYLAQAAPGVVIIMTSNHAFSTIPGCFPYNVAKTALTGLVRSLSIEWGPSIRTVGLAPGFIDTPGNQQWFDSFSDPDEARTRTIDLHPVKRIGTAAEMGAWCVFLASGYGAFASGTTYLVDGGRSAFMQDGW